MKCCRTNLHGGFWPYDQAHSHASAGGHVHQCVETENVNLALEELIQAWVFFMDGERVTQAQAMAQGEISWRMVFAFCFSAMRKSYAACKANQPCASLPK